MRHAVLDVVKEKPAPPPPAFGPLAFCFGIALPLLCLVLDPLVFQVSGDWMLGPDPLLPRWQAAAYVFVVLQASGLVLLGVGRPHSPRGQAFLAGMFLVAWVVALLAGIALLPWSVIGLIVIIGVFGFVPFGTAWVYGMRWWSLTKSVRPSLGARALLPAAGGFLLALALPSATYQGGRALHDSIVQGLRAQDSAAHESAMTKVRWGAILLYPDDLLDAHDETADAPARRRIDDAHRTLTGQSVAARHEERLVQQD